MVEHVPVLLNEVIAGLNIKPDGTYVDLTVGRGGHSSEILNRLPDKNVATTQIYAAMADESKRESVNRITLKPMKTVQLKVVGQ